MGSGYGPGQTMVAAAEKSGAVTKGPTYPEQGPDLIMGRASVATRGPGGDGVARAKVCFTAGVYVYVYY